jgi:UDP-N-acetylmuramoyl-L-alanyl-D-glutamate--2,6-diaminopimelate ligase
MNDQPMSREPKNVASLGDVARAIGAACAGDDANVPVTGLCQDSRKVAQGDLFAARSGTKTDGWRFVGDALARGAVAVLVEAGTKHDRTAVPVLYVKDVRPALARASALIYGDPTASLSVVGITGTNGKTTTTFLSRAAITAAGKRAGLIGTVGYGFEDWEIDAPNTTPEADDIARIASEMLSRGATHLVMEVSSHALAQARVEAVRFQVAAFTNLTQDHLDFHGDMQAYGQAKARLFLDLAPAAAVINVDDPFGADLAGKVRCPLIRVSSAIGSDADVAPVRIEPHPRRTEARIRTPQGEALLDSGLLGAHNLSNLLVALGISVALGLPLSRAVRGLSETPGVPGRLERCEAPDDDVLVFVDYAHTPDALFRVLAAVKPIAEKTGRLVCIFGCGGDRDPKKRAPMGAAVARWADVAVVTTDNPRTEDAASIASAIMPGFDAASCEVKVELDRRKAIEETIGAARAGDVVLIAGKGHETYQIVGAVKRHFDDREEAKKALSARRERIGKGKA